MKTYSELISRTDGIFAAMQEVNPTLYNDLFGTEPTATFDEYVFFKAASKSMLPTIENIEDVKTVVTGVCLEYGEVWKQIKQALSITRDAEIQTTETTSNTDATDRTQQATDVQSGKGFNSSDFVESVKNTSTGSNTDTRTYNGNKTTRTTLQNPQEWIKREVSLHALKTLFLTVCDDILYNITLSIYE